MKRLILFVLVLLLGCTADRVQRVSSCGDPCHPEAQVAGVGECKMGFWSCPEDQDPICVSYTLPTEEACNGLDDDCDGQADEGVFRGCQTACGKGNETCVLGQWTACTAEQPMPEVCNGQDDDCDGVADNPEKLPMELCYDGPRETLLHGTCRPGVRVCRQGQWLCQGQVPPSRETCDQVDNDCDGQVDEGLPDQGPDVDFVFVIDNSGSMWPYIDKVRAEVQTWAVKYNRPNLRFALVVAPDNDDRHWGFEVRLYQDFTDARTFAQAVAQQKGTDGNGVEPTREALWKLAKFEPLATGPGAYTTPSWRTSATRVVILFTDELPQSPTMPLLTEADTASALAASGMQVHVFTDTWTQVPNIGAAWNPIPQGTGGALRSLSGPIAQDLDDLLASANCKQ